jgi:hypothetical protein
VIGLLGKAVDRSSKTVGEEPSGTALAVASLRAFAAAEEREEIRGKDTLAAIFLTEDRQRMVRDAAGRAWALKNAVPLGLYEYLIARTAYFDGAVEPGTIPDTGPCGRPHPQSRSGSESRRETSNPSSRNGATDSSTI